MMTSAGPDTMMEQAREHARRRDFASALRLFREVLALAPGRPEVQYEIGKICLEAQDYPAAQDAFRAEIAANPSHTHSYVLLGKSFALAGDHDRAMQTLDEALERDPSFPGIHLEKGNVFAARRLYDEALEEARREPPAEPPRAELHMLLGRVWSQQKKYGEAIAAFSAAVAADPGYGGVHCEWGHALFARGDNAAAIGEAAKEIARDPSHVPAYELMLQAFSALRREEEAHDAAWHTVADTFAGPALRDPSLGRRLLRSLIDVTEYCNVSGEHDKALALIEPIERAPLGLSSNEKNILLCEREVARGQARVRSKGRRLTVQLTNKCNLRCKMCKDGQYTTEEISPKVRDELLALMPYLQEVTWLGGEVFLYPDFNALFSAANAHGVKQHISTNGLLIDEQIAAQMIEHDVDLFFSVDAATADVYERIRRGARFQSLIAKLDMINALQRKIRPAYRKSIKMVVMRSNCHQICDFVAFAAAHRFNVIRYQFMINPGGLDDEDIFSVNRDPALLLRIARDLETAERMCRDAGIDFRNNITGDVLGIPPVESAPPGQTAGGEQAPHPRTDSCDRPRFRKCLAPWINVRIDAQGEVFPHLHFMCTTSVGNLNHQPMDAIWNGDKIVRYREALLAGDIEKICQLVKVYQRVPYEAFN